MHCTLLPRTTLCTRGRTAGTPTSPIHVCPKISRLQAWHLRQIFQTFVHIPQALASCTYCTSHCCTSCIRTVSCRMSSSCLELEHSLCSDSIVCFPAVPQLNEEMPSFLLSRSNEPYSRPIVCSKCGTWRHLVNNCQFQSYFGTSEFSSAF